MTPAEHAARLLLHLITLRGIHTPDIPAAIDAGHLTERDWCLTLSLMRDWEKRPKRKKTKSHAAQERWNAKRRAMRQGVAA